MIEPTETRDGPLPDEYDTWMCDDCTDRCKAIWQQCDSCHGARTDDDGNACEDCCGTGGGHVCAEELSQQNILAVPVTDTMVYAFHAALTNEALSASDAQDIRTGLSAALANLNLAPAELPGGPARPQPDTGMSAGNEQIIKNLHEEIDVLENQVSDQQNMLDLVLEYHESSASLGANTWYWQPDDVNALESLNDEVVIVIKAGDLKDIATVSETDSASSMQPSESQTHDISGQNEDSHE